MRVHPENVKQLRKAYRPWGSRTLEDRAGIARSWASYWGKKAGEAKDRSTKNCFYARARALREFAARIWSR